MKSLDEGNGIVIEVFHVVATLGCLALAMASVIVGDAAIPIAQGLYLWGKVCTIHKITVGKNNSLLTESFLLIVECNAIGSYFRHKKISFLRKNYQLLLLNGIA